MNENILLECRKVVITIKRLLSLLQIVPLLDYPQFPKAFCQLLNCIIHLFLYPLILAKIPVKNPWEIFAYLPFGGWNECPNTPELMAVAKYWFEQHGAVPAAMSHDELEFLLPAPVPEEKAMDAAVELYGFCPDVIDQGPEDATVGALADVLRQSTVWYFWWD